jgi:steroid delta-isomerase-like uncharacterized protein
MANIVDGQNEMTRAWNAHDAAKVASLYAEDCLYENEPAGAVAKGREAVKTFVEGVLSAFPDVKLEVKNSFVSGNSAAAEIVMSGTNTGRLASGAPATGKSFSVNLCAIAEYQGDLVKRNTIYWDMAALMRQLGLMPPAPG